MKDHLVRCAFVAIIVSCLTVASASGQTIGLKALSEESKACVECSKKESRALYQQWGSSKHYRANVGCYECHSAEAGDADAIEHEGDRISIIVSPMDGPRP